MSARKFAIALQKIGVRVLLPDAAGNIAASPPDQSELQRYFEKAFSRPYGVASGGGFCIVRVVGDAGKAAFRKLASGKGSTIPKTLAWKSGDGRCYLFRSEDDQIPDGPTSLAEGVHLVGAADKALGPGSKAHEGDQVRFLKNRGLGEVEPAVAPVRLVKSMRKHDWVLKPAIGVPIEKITVHEDRHRRVRPDVVKALAASMAEIGLRVPIVVSEMEHGFLLERGRHRLEAGKSLGWPTIAAVFQSGKGVRARVANLDDDRVRAELTVLERANNLQARILLLGKDKSAQLARPGGKQPNDKGIGYAADKLGLNRDEVRRLSNIAAISPKAQQVAIDLGLDDNQAGLLQIADEPNVKQQVAKAKELAQRKKEASPKKRKSAANGKASAKGAATETEILEVSESPPTAPEDGSDDGEQLDLEDFETTSLADQPASPRDDGEVQDGHEGELGIPAFLDRRPLSAGDQQALDAALGIFEKQIEVLLTTTVLRERWLSEVTRILRDVTA